MKAKSGESVAEALEILRTVGEMPTPDDSAFPGIADDLGELFRAELRRRRERLAKWLELLHAETRLEQVSLRISSPARAQCRGRAVRTTIGRRAARTR